MRKVFRLGILLFLLTFTMSFKLAYAETVNDYIRNKILQQTYNTKMSPPILEDSVDAESVSTQNGELSITQTDFSLPGKNGLDLNITRIYKSNLGNVMVKCFCNTSV